MKNDFEGEVHQNKSFDAIDAVFAAGLTLESDSVRFDVGLFVCRRGRSLRFWR